RRDGVRGLWPRLPLRDVAAAPPDAPLLVPRLADLPPALAFASESRAAGQAAVRQLRRAGVHCPPWRRALGGPLAHLLGLRAGGGGDLPALVRLDPLRDAARLAGDLPGLRLRTAGLPLPARLLAGAAGVQRARHLSSAGPRGHRRRDLAPRPRPRRARGAATLQRPDASLSPLRHLGHRTPP